VKPSSGLSNEEIEKIIAKAQGEEKEAKEE
jgi:hypothetical protein